MQKAMTVLVRTAKAMTAEAKDPRERAREMVSVMDITKEEATMVIPVMMTGEIMEVILGALMTMGPGRMVQLIMVMVPVLLAGAALYRVRLLAR